MDLSVIQRCLHIEDTNAPYSFRSAAEIAVAITEELGEVVTEVSLLERIGTKAGWSREPSTERLCEELLHLINTILALANHYHIDLDAAYQVYIHGSMMKE